MCEFPDDQFWNLVTLVGVHIHVVSLLPESQETTSGTSIVGNRDIVHPASQRHPLRCVTAPTEGQGHTSRDGRASMFRVLLMSL